MSLLIVTNATPSAEFSASISPSSYNVTASNGSFTTVRFKANAENNSGDLTYDWSYTLVNSQAATVTINSPENFETSLTVSSYNSNIQIILKCNISDDSETVSATSILNIQFGKGGIEP